MRFSFFDFIKETMKMGVSCSSIWESAKTGGADLAQTIGLLSAKVSMQKFKITCAHLSMEAFFNRENREGTA